MPPSFVGMVKKAIFPVRLSSECNTPERVFYLIKSHILGGSLKKPENVNLRYNALKQPLPYKIITEAEIPPKTPYFKRFTKGF